MFDASLFAFQGDFQEREIGLIDAVIIRSAMNGGHLLWTLDERIKSVTDTSQLFQWEGE